MRGACGAKRGIANKFEQRPTDQYPNIEVSRGSARRFASLARPEPRSSMDRIHSPAPKTQSEDWFGLSEEHRCTDKKLAKTPVHIFAAPRRAFQKTKKSVCKIDAD